MGRITTLDGKLAAFDDDDNPSFNALQNATRETSAVFFPFDVLVSEAGDVKMFPQLPACYVAVESSKQNLNCVLATVQLFWTHHPVWNVLLAKTEFVDVVLRLPWKSTVSATSEPSAFCEGARSLSTSSHIKVKVVSPLGSVSVGCFPIQSVSGLSQPLS